MVSPPDYKVQRLFVETNVWSDSVKDIVWTLQMPPKKESISHKPVQSCMIEQCKSARKEACGTLAAHYLIIWNQNGLVWIRRGVDWHVWHESGQDYHSDWWNRHTCICQYTAIQTTPSKVKSHSTAAWMKKQAVEYGKTQFACSTRMTRSLYDFHSAL